MTAACVLLQPLYSMQRPERNAKISTCLTGPPVVGSSSVSLYFTTSDSMLIIGHTAYVKLSRAMVSARGTESCFETYRQHSPGYR